MMHKKQSIEDDSMKGRG